MEYLLLIAVSVSLGTLSIYWMILLLKILRHKSLPKKHVPVSVIVCAHNELGNLKKLIPALLDQKHSEFELVIVDDRSEDGTYDYMLEKQSDQLKFVHVDQVHDHINAKKFALTLGIKAAQHEILLFTDADCIPSSADWITEMTGNFDKNTEYTLGVSPYNNDSGLLNHFIQFETHWTAMNYIGFALAGNPYMGVGRNLAYKKSSFLKHKGFSKIQHITGGDDDLLVNEHANKKNTKVAIGAGSLVYSIPKKTWSEFNRQKIRHWSVGRHYKWMDKFILGLQNFSNLVFWLALIILAMQTNNFLIPTGMLVFRMVFITILVELTSKKFGYRMNIWLVPMMDILYAGYASIFGVIALLTKKVRWKK
ncbi:MAG: glycosyltransferase [Reichenbachiella sp.]|uniref:glycosyltransferase n=1 Tax=Reichenbachiella sp. TaxID=2184521 RepID=UPI003264C04A